MLPDNIRPLQISKKKYPTVFLKDIEPKLDSHTLIKGVLLKKTLSVVYGASNSGKTFFALDLALSIASGRDWNGRESTRGMIFYIAAEGPHSVMNRVYAYKQNILSEYGHDIPFAVIPISIDLLNHPVDTEQIIEFIKTVESEQGEKCELLIVDTLARVMAGGNENGFDDMSAVVKNSDEIRQKLDCSFMFVHHAGKDATKGARGHTSLRAATDTEIEIVNANGIHTAKVTKQRDLPGGDEFNFKLKVVEIGEDTDGEIVTSCFPEWIGDKLEQPQKKRLSPQLTLALQILRETIKTDGIFPPANVLNAPGNKLSTGQKVCRQDAYRTKAGQRNLCESDKPDSVRRVLKRCLQELQVSGFIQVFDSYIWERIDRTKPDKH